MRHAKSKSEMRWGVVTRNHTGGWKHRKARKTPVQPSKLLLKQNHRKAGRTPGRASHVHHSSRTTGKKARGALVLHNNLLVYASKPNSSLAALPWCMCSCTQGGVEYDHVKAVRGVEHNEGGELDIDSEGSTMMAVTSLLAGRKVDCNDGSDFDNGHEGTGEK
eukprot:1157244-Pelagomonas_calceolata.AAC.2